MAVIQFSVPTSTLFDLLEYGRSLGLSEHQVAKFLVMEALDYPEEILGKVDAKRRELAGRNKDRKQRARPL